MHEREKSIEVTASCTLCGGADEQMSIATYACTMVPAGAPVAMRILWLV